jgi:hypothetical protein
VAVTLLLVYLFRVCLRSEDSVVHRSTPIVALRWRCVRIHTLTVLDHVDSLSEAVSGG